MAVKIYSDRTNQFYDSIEAANKAEFALKEKENLEKIRKEREAVAAKEKKEKETAERKAMAAEVEAARQDMIKAQKSYRDKLEAFCKRWGAYHLTLDKAEDFPTLFDFFSWL